MTFVTNISLSDGFGSQYQHIISCILICINMDYTFIYTPIQKMEHNYDDDPHFIENIEEFINLRKFYTTIEEATETEKKNIQILDMSAKYVIDRNIDRYTNKNVLSIIRYMFWENKDIRSIFNKEYMNIVIHIRRPNPHDNRIQGANTDFQIYLNLIEKIRKENPFKKLLFHIHSQGEETDFDIFNKHDIILYLNCDLRESFLQMCAADILVISASSFSYIAGFICEGTVYYIPFWHAPINTWIPYDNNVVRL